MGKRGQIHDHTLRERQEQAADAGLIPLGTSLEDDEAVVKGGEQFTFSRKVLWIDERAAEHPQNRCIKGLKEVAKLIEKYQALGWTNQDGVSNRISRASEQVR
jgi:hypothetical protein